MQPKNAEALMLMAMLNQGIGRPEMQMPRKTRKMRARSNNPVICTCASGRDGFCKGHRAYVVNGKRDR